MAMVRNPCPVLLYMKSLWKVSFVCTYLLVSCKLCGVAIKTKKKCFVLSLVLALIQKLIVSLERAMIVSLKFFFFLSLMVRIQHEICIFNKWEYTRVWLAMYKNVTHLV